MNPSLLSISLFSTLLLVGVGCSSLQSQNRAYLTVPVDVAARSYDPVTEYLLNGSFTERNFGGKVFAGYQDLGYQKTTDGETRYVWAVIEEYYKEGGELKQGSGSSLPLALHLIQKEGVYSVIGHQKPLDGAAYGQSIQKIFPPDVAKKIAHQDASLKETITYIIETNRKDAEKYFDIYPIQ